MHCMRSRLSMEKIPWENQQKQKLLEMGLWEFLKPENVHKVNLVKFGKKVFSFFVYSDDWISFCTLRHIVGVEINLFCILVPLHFCIIFLLYFESTSIFDFNIFNLWPWSFLLWYFIFLYIIFIYLHIYIQPMESPIPALLGLLELLLSIILLL